MKEKDTKELSPSKAVAAKTIYEAFKILKAEGGELPGKEVIDRIRKNIEFTEWEKEIYIKTGYVRWEAILHFYTVDCAKAGYLRKSKGIWYLTQEGEEAIKKGAVGLLESASSAYKKWAADKKNKAKELDDVNGDLEEKTEQLQKANLDQLIEQAIDGIKQFINQKNPYEFQDIVAALLRAMGYHTPFVSTKRKRWRNRYNRIPGSIGNTNTKN